MAVVIGSALSFDVFMAQISLMFGHGKRHTSCVSTLSGVEEFPFGACHPAGSLETIQSR
jgi:hypothetical protein